jgi:hypothetical protein
MIFLVVIGGLGLSYMFYRALPLTVLSVLVMVGVIAWIAFGGHGEVSETITTAGAWITIAAFVIDVVRLVISPFRKRG